MDMNKHQEKYFAAKDSIETARIVLGKADRWFNNLDTNGYLDKLKNSWASYYGAYYSDVGSGHQITFSGEQGELVNLPVNHFRNICRHILTMVTANRPAMQARATNTDYKSVVQTKLANGLLDYYVREKRLEDFLHRAIESSVVLGSGYIKMEWNATAGEVHDYMDAEYKIDEASGEQIKVKEGFPIYEGDVKFTNLSPFDVVFDGTKEDSSQHDWVLTRTFKNRFDLAAKFPEKSDDILRMETKDEKERYDFNGVLYDETDDIAVYEFYHRKTEAMHEGRYMLFVDSNCVLMDTPMPYRSLPVYRVSPSDILGTPYGYSDVFDLLPIQDALNSLYSAVLTNQNASAVSNILVARGTDINKESLGGGLNVLEYNSQAGPAPQALNVAQTPAEVFTFMKMLIQDQETISGVNSVARGNPEASLKSGNALALVQSMALQFISSLQQSYVKLIEDVGTGLINMLKDFAAVPRVAMIVGKANKTYMEVFTGDDLSQVNRVIVDVGNALSKTAAGRVQMAEQLLQMNLIKTPEQYISVMNTGQLETMTDGVDRQLMLVKAENEALIAGEEIQVIATESHSMHIKEHGDILADPQLKKDGALVERVLRHINEHIAALRLTDPDLLTLRGEQPLSPPGGSPANQPAPQDMITENGMGVMDEMVQGPETAAQNPQQNTPGMPGLPTPPAPFENLPVTADQMVGQS